MKSQTIYQLFQIQKEKLLDLYRKKKELAFKASKVNIVFDPPWDKDMMSEEAKLDLGMI